TAAIPATVPASAITYLTLCDDPLQYTGAIVSGPELAPSLTLPNQCRRAHRATSGVGGRPTTPPPLPSSRRVLAAQRASKAALNWMANVIAQEGRRGRIAVIARPRRCAHRARRWPRNG